MERKARGSPQEVLHRAGGMGYWASSDAARVFYTCSTSSCSITPPSGEEGSLHQMVGGVQSYRQKSLNFPCRAIITQLNTRCKGTVEKLFLCCFYKAVCLDGAVLTAPVLFSGLANRIFNGRTLMIVQHQVIQVFLCCRNFCGSIFICWLQILHLIIIIMP